MKDEKYVEMSLSDFIKMLRTLDEVFAIELAKIQMIKARTNLA